jgi:amino acid transporter
MPNSRRCFPGDGAEYVYLREAWPGQRWLPGTIGWLLAIAGVATTATVAMAFAGYASRFVATPTWLIAALLIVAAITLNVVGIKEASWTNIVFTLIEAAGLVALIVVGMRNPAFGDVFWSAPHMGVLRRWSHLLRLPRLRGDCSPRRRG